MSPAFLAIAWALIKTAMYVFLAITYLRHAGHELGAIWDLVCDLILDLI